MLSDLASLYKLTGADIAPLEGFGELSANNLMGAIGNSRNPQLGRFLYALGIPNVGEKTAADIARSFGSFAAIRSGTTDQLLEVEGVGPIVAQSIVDFFANPAVQAGLDRLLQEVSPQPVPVRERPETNISGKTFVFTGSLERFSRNEAQIRVEALGGKTTSTVSRNTDYLVRGPGAGSKLEKARKLDIQILDEEEFLKLIGEESN